MGGSEWEASVSVGALRTAIWAQVLFAQVLFVQVFAQQLRIRLWAQHLGLLHCAEGCSSMQQHRGAIETVRKIVALSLIQSTNSGFDKFEFEKFASEIDISKPVKQLVEQFHEPAALVLSLVKEIIGDIETTFGTKLKIAAELPLAELADAASCKHMHASVSVIDLQPFDHSAGGCR